MKNFILTPYGIKHFEQGDEMVEITTTAKQKKNGTIQFRLNGWEYIIRKTSESNKWECRKSQMRISKYPTMEIMEKYKHAVLWANPRFLYNSRYCGAYRLFAYCNTQEEAINLMIGYAKKHKHENL